MPIGDCLEPSRAEQLALGCPTTAPTDGTACAMVDQVCRYAITVDENQSRQQVLWCLQGTWLANGDACGMVCSSVGSSMVEFDVTGCAERTPTRCDAAAGHGYPPSAKINADRMLSRIFEGCGGPQDVIIRLSFENGCPQLLTTTTTVTVAMRDCLVQALSAVRWECAQQLPCAGYTNVLL